ncbi:putative phloem protein [Medicago truncatula]|uniref:Phloem protein 2-B5 n=1 Tax=Medicago truncatula TaxID=3880 RepID=G7I5K7_MEDTR|nr:F-box protein PP2-B11 [Medicago truncatula]AES61128.1 phloem protein 2-B5 [Medicago truncatula]RHN80563.1 putative phloem protein [Medicago truncatula]
MTRFDELPEGCIATILSRTTPIDVGRFSVLSKIFRFAADSDDVWNHFLPSDISSILSQSPALSNIPTKKALYHALSDRPIIINHGQKSFQLERKSGKKCYMLAARSLGIAWGDDDRYCNWIDVPDSRFPEVAYLRLVWWHEIRGVINDLALSPNTRYAAYLVFKMIDAHGFRNLPVDLFVGIEGGLSNTKTDCLEPKLHGGYGWYCVLREVEDIVVGLPRPSVRSDGWLEIEMGEFFNSSLEDEEIQMSVVEKFESDDEKGNFYLEGIELRPKVDN